MNKRKNIVLFTIIFMFVLIHVGKNSNFRGAKKYFITLKITWILMFGGLGLDPANAKDNSVVPGAHGFKPPVPARNLNNRKSNNPALGGAGRKSNTSKPPRPPSGFRLSVKPSEKQNLYGGATGNGGGSGGSGDDSDPFKFDIESSDQCQDFDHFSPGKKKKEKAI